MPSNINKPKLNYYLSILLFIILFILLEVLISLGTQLSPGTYGRYLDTLWASQITQTGHITDYPFPITPGLYSNANAYHFNLIPSVIISTFNLITNIDIIKIQMLPIYGFAYIISIILSAYALYKKNIVALIFAILLSCFFLYPINGLSREINRIILSYFIFFFFLYSFIQFEKKKDYRFGILQAFFLIYFIFTYSSIAVSSIFLIALIVLLEALRSKDKIKINLGILYLSVCLFYYLLITDFLTSGIIAIKTITATRGIDLDFSSIFSMGGWPTPNKYTPQYTIIDRFFLIYPFIMLGIFMLITFLSRLKRYKTTKTLKIYDVIFFSSVIFIPLILLFNTFAILPTSGLDYIALFGWLAPILAVYSLKQIYCGEIQFSEIIKKLVIKLRLTKISLHLPKFNISLHKFKVIIIAMIILLGIISIYNYNSLEIRKTEAVSVQEVATASWLGLQNQKITSDFNFLSTYVTINFKNANHYIPLNEKSVNSTYYQFNKSSLQIKDVKIFVITDDMRNHYIFNFEGTRTLPNHQLDIILSNSNEKIYDNGKDIAYYLIYNSTN